MKKKNDAKHYHKQQSKLTLPIYLVFGARFGNGHDDHLRPRTLSVLEYEDTGNHHHCQTMPLSPSQLHFQNVFP